MDPRLLIAHAVKVAVLATLVGLWARDKGGRCQAMVAYLLVALIGNSLTTFWPDIFFNWPFWIARQALFDILKLLIGIEIAVRAFRVFPGARARWRAVVLASIVFPSTAAFLLLPRQETTGTLFALQPQVVAATVWLYTATALVIVYHRIPVDPWHRAILLGFTPYQLVFTFVVTILRHTQLQLSELAVVQLGLAESAVYLVMVTWWAREAWRREPALDHLSPAVRRVYQLQGAS